LFVYELEEEPFSNEGKSKLFKKWFEQDKKEEYDSIIEVLQNSETNLLRLLSSQNTDLITDEILSENDLKTISELRNAISNLEKYGIIYIPILENEFMEQNKYKKKQDFLNNIFLTPKSHYIKEHLCE
tara:strand:+ start:1024 stop:1407 length:384 start_codon:yes stop_codon:yes gene_type:complete